ncbi:hypothetical protein GOOTI_256_00380 [Gordonia otitidis NBRC 100426]|uniref:Uncharacterized protein n=1 Tax=Gordonia otitidis (strain DSM 44809 / CCUG 52243 / JCM 12355 / NBRC 100426 / IFM 10032) TaxID=1108044 RepID=H5TUB2_GORO1|nr:hypothetical protein GOOTI_256_00380 [Gordonia otitidis NBRC 100426]
MDAELPDVGSPLAWHALIRTVAGARIPIPIRPLSPTLGFTVVLSVLRAGSDHDTATDAAMVLIEHIEGLFG